METNFFLIFNQFLQQNFQIMNQKNKQFLKGAAMVAFLMCCALGSEAQAKVQSTKPVKGERKDVPVVSISEDAVLVNGRYEAPQKPVIEAKVANPSNTVSQRRMDKKSKN